MASASSRAPDRSSPPSSPHSSIDSTNASFRGIGFCARVRSPSGEDVAAATSLSAEQSSACARDDSGSWRVSVSADEGASALRSTCARLCGLCRRCRYVSFSASVSVCAWYAHCEKDDLRYWWSHSVATVPWETLQLRTRIPRAEPAWDEPAGVPRLRLGLATLSFGEQVCAMARWCQAAGRLRWTLEGAWQVHVLILRSARRRARLRHADFCAGAEVVPMDEGLHAAAASCLGRGVRAGYHTAMPVGVMLKWQFVGMRAYDAVLFADQDTDIFPFETDAPALRRRWQQMLPVFLRPRHSLRVDGVPSRTAAMRLLTSTDQSSPVNTGLMLIKPTPWLYQDGLRVLRSCAVNKSHGWGYVGKPRMQRITPRYFSATAGGSTTVRPHVNQAYFWFTDVNRTGAMTKQLGFFWYMFFLRHNLGVYFNPGELSAPGKIVHIVDHYYGKIAGAKAWEGKLWNEPAHLKGQASGRLGMNLHYLSRLEPRPTGEEGSCDGAMRTLRRTAEAHPLAQKRRSAYTGASPPRFAIW
ncbi:hypothetical protein AB1Y20_002124 [Prymnesium parvum]|uniref:Nucleotide-diphospho-sugar transferase domain-containing protein n=1 Tax=Prymnesium parvum TaxID=97485 RepID=A0AB34J8I1_PRYPA